MIHSQLTVKCSNGLNATVRFNPEEWAPKKSLFDSLFGKKPSQSGTEEESKNTMLSNSDWTLQEVRKSNGGTIP